MAAQEHTIPDLDKKGLREFGVTIVEMFALLFVLFFPWLLNVGSSLWRLALFTVLASLGVVVPTSLRIVYRVSMCFGLLMSRVMTPLVPGFVFFGVVQPLGMIMRLFRSDPMARRLESTTHGSRVDSMKAPWQNLEKPF